MINLISGLKELVTTFAFPREKIVALVSLSCCCLVNVTDPVMRGDYKSSHARLATQALVQTPWRP